jgi:hypothetical protein
MKQKYITTILVAIPLCLLIIVLVMKHGPRVQDAAAPAPPTGVCKLKDGSSLPPGATSKCEKQMSQSDCMYNPTTVPPVTTGQCTWVPAPKPSPAPPKPSPAPPKPSPAPPKPSPPKPPAPPTWVCKLKDGSSLPPGATSKCEKQMSQSDCMYNPTTVPPVTTGQCTWVPAPKPSPAPPKPSPPKPPAPAPPSPPKPPPSPARPKCHTNLITQLAPDGQGLPACRADKSCTQDPLTCQSYGIPLSCKEQTTQATCEEKGGGGPHPLDPSRPMGQCKWDTAKGSCGPNLTYMQNVCNNSVQVTQIEDECKGLNQSQCTSPARNNCEWRFADKTCRYKIDDGDTAARSVTQFENCKWVGPGFVKKSGLDVASMCVPQSFADGVNEAVACTPGDWGSGAIGGEFQMPPYPGGDLSSCPANKVQCKPSGDFINGNFNSANGHIESCECSGHKR